MPDSQFLRVSAFKVWRTLGRVLFLSFQRKPTKRSSNSGASYVRFLARVSEYGVGRGTCACMCAGENADSCFAGSSERTSTKHLRYVYKRPEALTNPSRNSSSSVLLPMQGVHLTKNATTPKGDIVIVGIRVNAVADGLGHRQFW